MEKTRLAVLIAGDPVPSAEVAYGNFADFFAKFVDDTVELSPYDIRTLGASTPLPDLSHLDGAILSGSSHMVADNLPWIEPYTRLIKRLTEAEFPLLAVCFGHQLLGVAFGATVGPNTDFGYQVGTRQVTLSETGDPLFKGLPKSFQTNVSHVDVMHKTGPHLRSIGYAEHDQNQVVKYGEWCWGVQFHPEFTQGILHKVITERVPLIEKYHGTGSAQPLYDACVETPESASLVGRFAALCAERKSVKI